MDSSSEIFQKRYKEVEARILKVGSWTVLSAKLSGYFPYTVRNGELRLHYCSIPAIVTTLLIPMGLVYFWGFSAIQEELHKLWNLHSFAEKFPHAFFSYMLQVVALLIRVTSLVRGRAFIKFWEDTVSMTTHISLLAKDTNNITEGAHVLSKELQEQIRSFRRTTRNRLLVLVALAVAHFAISSGLRRDRKDTVSFLVQIVMPFWFYNVNFHSCFCSWVNFFPSLYTACFINIRYRLQLLASNRLGLYANRNEVHPHGDTNKVQDVHRIIGLELENYRSHLFLSLKNNAQQFSYNDQNASTEQIVGICLDLYSRVEEQIQAYNRVFGNYFLLNVLASTIAILMYAYFTFLWNLKGIYGNIIVSAIPLYIFSSDMFALASSADQLEVEAQRSVEVFNFLPLGSFSDSNRRKIQGLSLNLLSNPPRIQPGMYFTLNKSLLTSIVSAITMYLIVLVQFELSDL